MKINKHTLPVTELSRKLLTSPDELVAWMQDFIDEICDSCQELDFDELSISDDLTQDQIEQLAIMLIGHFYNENVNTTEVIILLNQIKFR